MKKLPLAYLLFFAIVMPSWLIYMSTQNGFSFYQEHWPAAVTMFFGSFVAGATSEGGGAVAFPVFTLLLKLPPPVARNFSFAIQSIGMTSASLLIISLKINVDWKAIRLVTVGGIPGLLFGAFFIVPLISGPMTKIFFVSLWLSFAFALYLANRKTGRQTTNGLGVLSKTDYARILTFAFVGGVITAIFGDGINIFTFCLFTLYYTTSEKIATPTSIIIMTIHTIIGFMLHVFVFQDFQPVTFRYWMCAIPVVIFMAPLGAYIINFLTRETIANFLYITTVIQYVGALAALRPPVPVILISFGIVVSGFLFFWWLSTVRAGQPTRTAGYLASNQ
nr:sulfite exporter TauE/SafE family protein [uncultured Arsenicibacter sp.]